MTERDAVLSANLEFYRAFTTQDLPAPSLALSAYSAVTLRKMFPVHTNRTD